MASLCFPISAIHFHVLPPLPYTQSHISFKVFNCGHKHMYFLRDTVPTPPPLSLPIPIFAEHILPYSIPPLKL